jgi:5'-3' exonuclease
MILLIDADSMIFSACYRTRRDPDDSPYFEDMDEATDKFDEVLMSIVNRLDEQYGVEEFMVFSGSRGNFRKLLDPKYKAQRTQRDLPPLLDPMHQYVKEQYHSKWGMGYETDDLVASYWKALTDTLHRNEVCIVSIDKDYKQLPCLMYDYHHKKQVMYDINEWMAMYNFYGQMVTGDTADNVNFCKGYGQRWVEKNLAECETQYQFTKRVYDLFKQIYGSKARQKYIQCYHLLKLRTDIL